MRETKKIRSQQHWYYRITSLVFVTVALGIGYYIYGAFTPDIGYFEFIIMALAVYRLTQLFVYDQIMRFVRDAFSDIEEREVDGEMTAVPVKPRFGFRRSMFELLECPWCVGMWMAWIV